MVRPVNPKQRPPVAQWRVKSPKPRRLRLLWLSAFLALVVGFAYAQLNSFSRPPEVVLVLGGDLEREKFATEFAREHPGLPIWVSGGSNPEYAELLFAKARIERDRVHLDYDAVDTLTNFTTTVDKLAAQGVESIYLITSDYHMRRARIIGAIVLTSRGMSFKPVPVPSGRPPEPLEKALVDGARAVLWLTTGSTGSTLGQALKSQLTPSEATFDPKGRPLELEHRAEQLGP